MKHIEKIRLCSTNSQSAKNSRNITLIEAIYKRNLSQTWKVGLYRHSNICLFIAGVVFDCLAGATDNVGFVLF